jgi:hypothetical protein
MWLTAAIKHAFFETSSVETYYFVSLAADSFDLGTTWLIFYNRAPIAARVGNSRSSGDGDAKVKEKRAAERMAKPVDARSVATLAAACYAFNPAIILILRCGDRLMRRLRS